MSDPVISEAKTKAMPVSNPSAPIQARVCIDRVTNTPIAATPLPAKAANTNPPAHDAGRAKSCSTNRGPIEAKKPATAQPATNSDDAMIIGPRTWEGMLN
ncbi:hypothetical protein D3C81_1991320 [compost metagenome]